MKRTLKLVALLSIIIFGTISCNKTNKAKEIGESSVKAVAQSKFAKMYPLFNPENFRVKLQSQIEQDSLLIPLYNSNNHIPIWSNDTLNTSRLYTFIDLLDRVHEHGLSSKLFDSDMIRSLTDSIESGIYTELDTLYLKLAELEKVSSKSLMKYTKGMSYGFLNPGKIYKKDYDIAISLPDSSYYESLYQKIAEDPITAMLESHPQSMVYKKMQEELSNWEAKKDAEWSKIQGVGSNVYKIGSKNKNIAAIAKRLSITGEYTVDSTLSDTSFMVLDENLLAAINKFRNKISYPEEPEVGSITIEALNRPASFYQDMIKANMERYRWKHIKEKHDKHIDVIIPAFKLIASQKNDSIPLIMRVCVGTSRNKTPSLDSNIGYINLNPKWNVPKSIARGEISYLQKKDRTYLKKRNMKLFKNGKEVDPETIDWDKVEPSKFNYFVRQDSGDGNSLGRIKFMFNNNFAVYLHDTPVKRAFLRKNRAVSHGCVRVQQPIDLAFFCLPTPSDEYKDRLRYSIDRNPETKEGKDLLSKNKLKKLSDIINATEKISLTIDYHTVYMHPHEDILYYADDVYDYDSIILKMLSI